MAAKGVGLALATATASVLVLATLDAPAQHVDPKRPSTLIVGPPQGYTPMARIDAARSGLVRAALPTGTLEIAWKKPLGVTLEHPALVRETGEVIVVTSRGEVFAWDAEGNERARTAQLNLSTVGPPALLSDGAIAFTAPGEVVFVRGAQTRRIPLTGERGVNAKAAPLPLEDGGIVVVTPGELILLDADGNVRTRAALEEPVTAPLVSALGKIAAITATGRVLMWSPGREPVRAGSFGGAIDVGAALVDDHTLLGVVDASAVVGAGGSGGGKLVELDLTRGVAVTRTTLPGGNYLGPPAVRGDAAYVMGLALARTFVLAVDGAGQEVFRVPVALFTPPAAADGGAAPMSIGPHAAPLVDAAGHVAYATPEGQVGVLATGQSTPLLTPCGRSPLPFGAVPRQASPVVGLSPAPGAVVVTCESGNVVKLTATARATPP
jgi:outer membrane protein assembly factor BamB